MENIKSIEEMKEAEALIRGLNDKNFLFFRGMVQTATAFFLNSQQKESDINVRLYQNSSK